jgi:NAD(P)-dependent dehydrogenase (short-subunit alcohol dehydrogenase family)
MTSTYLVVGASTGLGRALAERLSRKHRVLVAGRNKEADVSVDLRDLASVERAADEVRAKGPLAGIVCNAGVQNAAGLERTPAGHEETFAINHLAHFAFLARLAPPRETRVAFIGSGTLDPEKRAARMFGFRGGLYTSARELAAGEGYPPGDVRQRGRDRYATSKLCNLLTARALARRGVHAFAFDPGLMPGTGLARTMSAIERAAWKSVMRVLSYAMPGASTTGRSAAALEWALENAGPGEYVDFHAERVPMPKVALNEQHSEELYAGSLALLGVERDPFA